MSVIGAAVPGFQPPLWPPHVQLAGRHCRVTPLDIGAHAAALFAAVAPDADRLYQFVGYGPFRTENDLRQWLIDMAKTATDTQLYVIETPSRSESGHVTWIVRGIATYLRITPSAATIEIGHIVLSVSLQRTRSATEALSLMMGNAFALGYRRVEWKTNFNNKASIAAGKRLGFSPEGVFRQARVDKGCNRDTAWLAIVDWEWPRVRAAIQQFLDDANYDETGRQRRRLSSLTAPLLAPMAKL